MTTIQTLGLSVSLLVNAMLIVWCMYNARRSERAIRIADDAQRDAWDAMQRAVIAQRLVNARREEIDTLEQEVK